MILIFNQSQNIVFFHQNEKMKNVKIEALANTDTHEWF